MHAQQGWASSSDEPCSSTPPASPAPRWYRSTRWAQRGHRYILIPVSIGGDDAEFADIYLACVSEADLLPGTPAAATNKVTESLKASFARLDGADPGGDTRRQAITPYRVLHSEVLSENP